MPWSGGVFTRTNGEFTGTTVWQTDALNDILIESDRHDTHDQDLADGIAACLNRDGTTVMGANLDMGGFNIVNAGAIDDGTNQYVTLDETISGFSLSSNKILTAVRASLPDLTVSLVNVMNGAGTALAFDTGTNILSMPRQNFVDSEVNLSSLAGTAVGWGPPETADFTINPGDEKNCLGPITVTVAAAFNAGDVITMHNYAASGSDVTVDYLTNGYSLTYGGDVYADSLILESGDTVTIVALNGTTLEII